MGLGDIFTTTFSVFRRRTGPFLGLTALQQLVTAVLVVVPLIVAVIAFVGQVAFLDTADTEQVIASVMRTMGIFAAVLVVVGLVAGVISLYFSGLMITIAHEATQQRFPTLTEARALSRGFVLRFAPVYVVAMLLYGACLLVAMLPMVAGFLSIIGLIDQVNSSSVEDRILAAMLGGFFLSMLLMLVVVVAAYVVEVKLAYVMQVCALEGLSGMAALRRAWRLTNEAFWRTLGFLIVFALAAGAAQQVVSVAGQAIMSVAGASTSAYSSSGRPSDVLEVLQSGAVVMAALGVYAVMMLVELLIVPMKLIFVTVMYGDQLRRRELGPVNHAFGMNVPQYGRPGAW